MCVCVCACVKAHTCALLGEEEGQKGSLQNSPHNCLLIRLSTREILLDNNFAEKNFAGEMFGEIPYYNGEKFIKILFWGIPKKL